MKKVIKGLIITLGIFLGLIIVVILFIGRSQFSFSSDDFTQNDYSYILEENIKGNPRVIDIAMLGAHDAFSENISKGSLVDPQEDEGSILNNNTAKILAGGMFVRSAKAQKSSVSDLLSRGVRYLDVRITLVEGIWYTTHGLISAPLEGYLKETINFLDRTKKEIIIFDIQHAYTGELAMEDLFKYIDSIRVKEKSVFDFVYYEPENSPLGTLTYQDTTKNGSGIVVLAKAETSSETHHYKYEKSMRSVWHNKNTKEEMLDLINQEYKTLLKDKTLDRDKFRINQVQMTAKTSGADIMATLRGWSLLDMADRFNAELINQEDFSSWFAVLPIFMTDYSDSMTGDFNDEIIKEINLFNEGLK